MGALFSAVNGIPVGEAVSPLTIKDGAHNATLTVDGSGNLTIEQTGTDTFFEAGRVTVRSSSVNAFSVTNTPGSVIAFHADASNARLSVGGANPITALDVQAGDVTIRNGTTPTRLDLYSTRTDADNYERLSLFGQSADSFVLASEAAGTGTVRDVELQGANFILDSGLALKETVTPPSGVADQAILFAQDNGAGKTQLMVQFPTGAAQQVAIEA